MKKQILFFDEKVSIKELSGLPEVPGVYGFLDASGELLYIGKATSLRDRVRSYFSGDILETRGPKIALMLKRADQVGYRATDSVLEALLLESKLIKENEPPYNTDLKDNKSFQYGVITEEAFPRVLLVRGRDIAQGKFREPVAKLYGPFPSGGQLQAALKIVRTLFPFRDRCVPESGKPCFHRQIGLCPGVCDGSISKTAYRKEIRNLMLFFEGKKGMVQKRIERDMQKFAKEERFEEANECKKKLFALKHIEDMTLVKDEYRELHPHRIEAYDVAHVLGEAAVGVMTVVENGRPNKDEYRQFILRKEHKGNDLTALEETLSRRLEHDEWRYPEIIIVDGSFLQSRVAEKVLSAKGLSIPVIGVVKNAQHKPESLLGPAALLARFESDALLANAEAHRFALALHRKRRRKEWLSDGKSFAER